MKNVLLTGVLGALTLLAAPTPGWAEEGAPEVRPQDYYGRIAQRLAVMLPRNHVLQKPLDDEISRRAWTNLVSFYDFDRSVFLRDDLDRLAARDRSLDDELRAGDVSFGYDVHRLYCTRLRERIDFATNLLATATWDFSVAEDYRIKRKDVEWPATRAAAEEHWRKRLKNELLVQILGRELDAEEKAAAAARKTDAATEAEGAEGAAEETGDAAAGDELADDAADDLSKTPAENLIKRYRQYLTVLTEPDEEAVLQHYFSAVCHAYDPHTDYLSPTSKEDFDMDMNLTLCGVGAVLQMDDGALKISEVMPGGPMDVDGRIKAGDRIVGVQQGDGEMEDIMWQPMKKTIKKIRGKKGTRVTLEIIPRTDSTGIAKKRIELVRDEIRLEDEAATGRVDTVVLEGVTNRVGYVYLPGFYGTMDKRPGQEGFRSCADDVARYLADFNARDVEGLVLDLREDGGGSLREAVMLSALFVPSGPVVQIRDTRTVMSLPIPAGNPVAFRKPMVVLTDRASASASEIVAGHLRDTGRAVVLGDVRTHGKGTVQTVLGMGPARYGSMKITTARFYRIDGRSTQVKGVEADIRLPSLLDSLDIGEDKLTYALPFTRIRKAGYTKCWNLDDYIPELAARSEKRLKDDPRYVRHLANVEGMRRMGDRERVPLERQARKEMMRQDRAMRELDAAAGDEDGGQKPARRRRNQLRSDDVVLDAAYDILADLIRLNGGAKLPPAQIDWYNAILGF
ncbi:MAG: carboxy terminal-processing peptidase [Kiritimatiellia bacterium]